MEKEGALCEHRAGRIERREAQSVGMLRVRPGRKHDVAMEEQIARFVEMEWTACRQDRFAAPANRRHRRVDRRRIDRRRLVARQTQQHGAVGGVTQAGQRQRAVELHLHTLDAVQHAALGKLARKPARRAHRPHRVRTRRTDADFVEIEETRRHASDCSLQ